MEELHDYGSFADGRSDAFYATRPHIADGENARHTGFEQIGLPAERPIRGLEFQWFEAGADQCLSWCG